MVMAVVKIALHIVDAVESTFSQQMVPSFCWGNKIFTSIPPL